ncbi:MAG: tetratricopeptide repeat protein, partial [Bacteroidia bacterium]|nr:tetratricopeptide repeat protein [Bacteroidia bacterium]
MQNVINNIDAQEIDKLNEDAWMLNRKDPVKAIELSEKALLLSEKQNYKRGKALALKTLGAANVWISKNQDALKFSLEAIALFSELGDKKNEAETNYIVGANFRYISDYDSAIKYYNNCYNISKEIGDELGMADGLNGLGTVYYGIQENHKALDVLLESQNLCLKHNNKDIYIKVLDGIGEAYYNLGNYKDALAYYLKCATMSAELGNKQVEAFALDGLGRTYAALNQEKEAIQYFDKSLSLRREIGFKAGEVISLLNKGIFLIDKGELEESIKLLHQSLDLAANINSKEGVYKASEKLAIAYEKQGDYKNAIEFYKKFSSTRDEVITETTAQVVRSVEMQHKMLQSQTEKATLEQRAKELENYSENLVLLGEIGQKIISQLNVGSIVETVYDSVNKLMDAAGFGVGLFEKESNQIVFPLFIEGGEKFNNITYDVNDADKLSSICFTQSKELLLNDFDVDLKKYVSKKLVPTFGKMALSVVYLPLIVKGKTVGVITVQSFSKNAYNNYHVNILRNLASYTAIALDNAKLYQEQEKIIETRTAEVVARKEEIEKAYQNNKLLSELGQQITSAINFEEIFSKLNSYVSGLMDAGFFGVRLYNRERNVIEYKYGIEKGVRNPPIEVSMEDKDNYSVWCVTNKKDIFINDNEKEYKKYTNKIIVVTGDMPHSLIFSPILINDRVLGCITVQSFEKNAYTDYHLDILKTLATYTAI